MVKLKVEVTQEDICCGIRGKPTSCPIARSLSRNNFDPCVCFNEVSLYKLGKWDRANAKLPQIASDFAHNFDLGYPVSPIKFELDFADCNLDEFKTDKYKEKAKNV